MRCYFFIFLLGPHYCGLLFYSILDTLYFKAYLLSSYLSYYPLSCPFEGPSLSTWLIVGQRPVLRRWLRCRTGTSYKLQVSWSHFWVIHCCRFLLTSSEGPIYSGNSTLFAQMVRDLTTVFFISPMVGCESDRLFSKIEVRHFCKINLRLKKSWVLNRTRVPTSVEYEEFLRSERSTIWASRSRHD